ALAWLGDLKPSLLVALLGGTVVAAVGFADDKRSVHAGIRLAVHIAAGLWAVFWLGGLPPLRIGDHLVQLGWPGWLLAVLGITWTVNLFNFMDGIDGLAAAEAAFIACAGATLGLASGHAAEVSAVAFAFAATCSGFLLWNWPPAKVFMGDVGSGYVGYVIGVLTLAASRDNPVAVWIWLLLGGAFFVDATVTLVRRMLRGEAVHEAHRSHAYQWLARPHANIMRYGASSSASKASNKAALQIAISLAAREGFTVTVPANIDYGYQVSDVRTYPDFKGIESTVIVMDYGPGSSYAGYPTAYDGSQLRVFFHTPQTPSPGNHDGNGLRIHGAWHPYFSINNTASVSAPGDRSRTALDNRRASILFLNDGRATYRLGQGTLAGKTHTDDQLSNFVLEMWHSPAAP